MSCVECLFYIHSFYRQTFITSEYYNLNVNQDNATDRSANHHHSILYNMLSSLLVINACICDYSCIYLWHISMAKLFFAGYGRHFVCLDTKQHNSWVGLFWRNFLATTANLFIFT